MDLGNYSETAQGSITEISEKDINNYAGGSMIHKAKSITHVGNNKGISHANPQKAPKKDKKKNETKNYTLPLLIGYSKGYDNTHSFPNSSNDDVKKIALNLEDSTTSYTDELPDIYDNYSNYTTEDCKDHMLSLLKSGSTDNNGMRAVVMDMYKQFISKNGGEFSNTTLNAVIEKDANYVSFDIRALYKILIKLKSINWDLSKLDSKLVRFNNVAFNRDENHSDGLTITIDAVEHIEVYITEFTPPDSSGTFHVSLKFILYDTFGLDLGDIDKFGERKGVGDLFGSDNSNKKIYVREMFGKGFNCWWLLQHKFGYKPLSTKVIINRTGTYNIHDVYRNPGNASKNTSNDISYD
jgi:hypothetical protein